MELVMVEERVEGLSRAALSLQHGRQWSVGNDLGIVTSALWSLRPTCEIVQVATRTERC